MDPKVKRILDIVTEFTNRVGNSEEWKENCAFKSHELFLAYEGEEHSEPDMTCGCELTNALCVAALLVHHVGGGPNSEWVRGWTDCDARRKLQEAMAHLSASFVRNNATAQTHLVRPC